jgi:DeoR family fructose operon transcriptional repressor
MFAIERIMVIKKYLKEHNQADVQSLSSLLGVSEVTIRRDLVKLEKDGFLTRTHGGAVVNQDEPTVELISTSPDKNAEMIKQCNEIANISIRMLQPRDIIMITSGETNLALAKKIHDQLQLTVLTNDLQVAITVAKTKTNKVVLLGGEVDEDGIGVLGSMALENLKRYRVKQLFIECDGINNQLELTFDDQKKADLVSTALELSSKINLLCPAFRFGQQSFFSFKDISITDSLITNPSLSDDFKNKIVAKNISLFTAIDAFERFV